MENLAEQEQFFKAMTQERFDLAIQLHGGGRYSNPFLIGQRTTRFNADGGTRTHDLMLRRHALYPLSYVSMGTV